MRHARRRRSRPGSSFALFATMLVLSSCAAPESAPEEAADGGPASADPTALAAADSLRDAIGGREGWQRARYFTFDFVVYRGRDELVRRSHRWDRFGDRHRVRGTTRDGAVYLVFRGGEPGGGRVFLEDAELAADSVRAEWLERAHSQLVNDFYWFAMPFKLHDPGVHLADEGARTDSAGTTWRVLRLSFDDGVGLTSGDRYWIYLDPESYLVGRWDYLLEGMDPEGPPRSSAWVDWREVGPIRLSLERRPTGSEAVIRFENVSVSEEVPPDAFDASGV